MMESVVAGDIDEVERIVLIQDEAEREVRIHQKINAIIEGYKNSKEDYASFSFMMKRFGILRDELYQMLKKIKEDNGGSRFVEWELDRAWDKNQVKTVVEIFEHHHLQPGAMNRLGQARFWNIFVTDTKKEEEKNTVSDIFAEVLIEKIEQGARFSQAFQEDLRMWFQTIKAVHRDVRMDLLIAILNNPGAMDRNTQREALSNLGLYGRYMMRQLKDIINEYGTDVGKILNVIRILDYLHHKKQQSGFKNSAEEAEIILKEIESSTDNYFVKTKVAQLLTPPLENYQNRQRRDFLNEIWVNLMHPRHFHDIFSIPSLTHRKALDPSVLYTMDIIDPHMFSDEEVDVIFQRLRNIGSSYYYFVEHHDRAQRFEEEDLRKKYDIIPLAAINHYQQDRITQQSCYSRISRSYGAIYDLDGCIDSFFLLDPSTEQDARTSEEYVDSIKNIDSGTVQESFLADLSDKTHFHPISPKRVSIVEMLEREGFDRIEVYLPKFT